MSPAMESETEVPNSAAQRARIRDLTGHPELADPRDGGPGAHGGWRRRCITVGVEIRGPVDQDLLTARLARMVDRHPALGAVFDTSARHRLVPGSVPLLVCRRIDASPSQDAWTRAKQAAQEEAARPFGLGAACLVRATLFAAGADRQLLVVAFDQLVCDAWSANLAVAELFDDAAEDAGPDAYAAVWADREAWLSGPQGLAAVARRRDAAGGAAPRWPTKVRADPGHAERLEISVPVADEVTRGLRTRLRAVRGSMLAVASAALAAGIAEQSEPPLALRSTLAGRVSPAEAGVVGWLAAEAVLRLPPRTGTVAGYVTDLRSEVFAALADQCVPYELVEDVFVSGPGAGPSCGLGYLPQGLVSGGSDWRIGGVPANRISTPMCPTGADVDFYLVEDPPADSTDRSYEVVLIAAAQRAVAGEQTLHRLLDAWARTLAVLARVDWSTAPIAGLGLPGSAEPVQLSAP